MRRHHRVLVAVCLPIAACDLQEVTIAEPEPFIVVESYLFAGANFQWVALHGGGFEPNPLVDGALIELTGPGGTTVLFQTDPLACAVEDFDTAQMPAGFACYATPAVFDEDSLPFIESGELYRLTVTLADGATLRGATRVPGKYPLVGPGDTCYLPPRTQRELVWGRSSGAAGYLTEIRAFGLATALAQEGIEVDLPEPVVLRGLSVSTADTTIVMPREIGVFDRFSLEPALLLALQRGVPADVVIDVIVAAIDQNFVNWARGGDFNPSGVVRVPSVSGPGGTGVFASVTTRTFTASSSDTHAAAPLCGQPAPD